MHKVWRFINGQTDNIITEDFFAWYGIKAPASQASGKIQDMITDEVWDQPVRYCLDTLKKHIQEYRPSPEYLIESDQTLKKSKLNYKSTFSFIPLLLNELKTKAAGK